MCGSVRKSRLTRKKSDLKITGFDENETAVKREGAATAEVVPCHLFPAAA